MTRKRIRSKKTFTKGAVKILLFFGLVNATMPYILSALDKDPVVALGTAWLAEVVGVFAVYAFKAYFETKQEKKQNLENYKARMEYEGGVEDE